ncbi:ABC transporter substrate-binding protein [Muricoccus radiodurans]|uniref:ABC transporter substrate-binding protein n=1 Tax=Muricoccus radiodurans TaxID=2231721 RepID=UPI003CE8913A
MARFLRRFCQLGALAVLALSPARAETVLRVVPQADLRVLDPQITTATITRIHGQMIYDLLFAWDSELNPRPQMVGETRISDDRLTYEFTLRDGLRFHDGSPVTARDAVASIRRTARTEPLLQLLAQRTAALEAVDERRFRIVLTRPFAHVERALASPAAVVMRERDMEAAGNAPVTTTIGSGPFRFNRAGFIPAARIAYDRNPDYVPRAEPPSGLSGGKVVRLDRVEWHVIPDLATRMNAIMQGEVDLLDQLPHDGVAPLRRRRDVVVEVPSPLGSWAFLRPNALVPPFNDPRARQALALLVDQPEYLSAAFTTDESLWRRCFSFMGCDTPTATEAGSEPYRNPAPERARALLAEAGYRGEPIRILTTQEIPLIDALSQVTAARLRSIGVNVEMENSDWGTLVVRRARKDPPDRGGWHIFHTGTEVATVLQPATNAFIDTRCDGNNSPGWPCSEEVEALRVAAAESPTPERLAALNEALWRALPSIPLGQYRQLIARRSNVTGLVPGPVLVFWNIEKR